MKKSNYCRPLSLRNRFLIMHVFYASCEGGKKERVLTRLIQPAHVVLSQFHSVWVSRFLRVENNTSMNLIEKTALTWSHNVHGNNIIPGFCFRCEQHGFKELSKYPKFNII